MKRGLQRWRGQGKTKPEKRRDCWCVEKKICQGNCEGGGNEPRPFIEPPHLTPGDALGGGGTYIVGSIQIGDSKYDHLGTEEKKDRGVAWGSTKAKTNWRESFDIGEKREEKRN